MNRADARSSHLELFRVLVEAALNAEMLEHLKHIDPAHAGRANSRNGLRPKQLRTDIGDVAIAMPRDRLGTFDPLIVRKRQRSFYEASALIAVFLADSVASPDAQLAIAAFYPEHTPDAVRAVVRDALLAASESFRRGAPYRTTQSTYTVYDPSFSSRD